MSLLAHTFGHAEGVHQGTGHLDNFTIAKKMLSSSSVENCYNISAIGKEVTFAGGPPNKH